MLKQIVKRSGDIEEFTANKTNGWVLRIGHDILDRMDWSSIVIEARNTAPEQMTSQEWQMHLIRNLYTRGSQDDGWPYMLMAGRLYTVYLLKKIHGGTYPTLQEMQSKMVEKGLMRDLGYSPEEMAFLQDYVIDHEINMRMAYFQAEQFNAKYSLRDFVTEQTYETPQFTNMRMAMAIYENNKGSNRLDLVAKQYRRLNNDLINPPSPNYAALGTRHFGMASCCLIAATDDAQSIKIAGMIAYDMTLSSGGLGMMLSTRAPGDPVDGGRVMHSGRLNYIRKLVGDKDANKQGARGGAINVFDTVYNPEFELSAMIQNPRTATEVRERKMNVSYLTNPLFVKKAHAGEDYFTFTEWSAPDLYKAFFLSDQTAFEELYARYEANPDFKKEYRSARKTMALFGGQEVEQSTLFWGDTVQMNIHTPLLGTIIQSNLCCEILVVTKPWLDVLDLYDPEGDPEKGEVGICNIGSVSVHRHPFNPSAPRLGYELYKDSIRGMYEIIDYAIDNSEYHYPAITTQAHSRRNAAVGMSGIATLLAKLNLKFNSPEGRRVVHMLSERHAYACIEVALEMGIERGNAPWMDKTKWPQGWMPIDTYKKNIDKVVDSTLHFDWEDLRARVIKNKGIRFSTLIAHMPGEQATRKGDGSNSVYPLFNLSVDLSDGKKATPWAALDNDLIGHQYQNAYDLDIDDQSIHYGIIQKFTDQGISADEYEDRRGKSTIPVEHLLKRLISRYRYGMKTKYYTRTLTDKIEKQGEIEQKSMEEFPLNTSEASSALERIAARARAEQEDAGQSCTLDGNCGA